MRLKNRKCGVVTRKRERVTTRNPKERNTMLSGVKGNIWVAAAELLAKVSGY